MDCVLVSWPKKVNSTLLKDKSSSKSILITRFSCSFVVHILLYLTKVFLFEYFHLANFSSQFQFFKKSEIGLYLTLLLHYWHFSVVTSILLNPQRNFLHTNVLYYPLILLLTLLWMKKSDWIQQKLRLIVFSVLPSIRQAAAFDSTLFCFKLFFSWL